MAPSFVVRLLVFGVETFGCALVLLKFPLDEKTIIMFYVWLWFETRFSIVEGVPRPISNFVYIFLSQPSMFITKYSFV